MKLFALLLLELCSISALDPRYWSNALFYKDAHDNDCNCNKTLDDWMECSGPHSCSEFPSIEFTFKKLRISRTVISTIFSRDLAGFGFLEKLTIEDNRELADIESEAFSNLRDLKTLIITRNINLQTLAIDTFKGLQNLTTLDLTGNGFLSIGEIAQAISPDFLPNLLIFSLSQNPIIEIQQDDLTPLNESRLTDFKIRLCQLDYIHPEALTPLRYLRKLQLSENPSLSAVVLHDLIEQLARDNVTLDVLELRYMGFQELPKDLLETIGELGVVRLDLQGNLFQNLARGSFPRMPMLESLSLIHCLISSVEPDVFDPSLMPKLKVLKLGNNMLTGLSHGVLPSQITEIDFTRNSYFQPQPISFDIGEDNFINMLNLSSLNMSYLPLHIITVNSFHGLRNLNLDLGLKNSSITYIEPGSFRDLVNLTILNLENNPFPAVSGMTNETFRGLSKLIILNLKGCRISNISQSKIFSPLSSLKQLMLDNNNILKLQAKLFMPLRNLVILSLSNNRIEPWVNESLFRNNKKLSTLQLNTNRLTYFSPAMLSDFVKVKTLDLSNNDFFCDCKTFYPAKRWLNMRKLNVNSIITSKHRPYCYAPDRWKNRYVTDFIELSDIEYCPLYKTTELHGHIWAITVLGIVFLIIVLFSLIICRYRSHIRYWKFLAKVSLRKRGILRFLNVRRSTPYASMDYPYDALVSYSSENSHFTVRLVSMLENHEPFLKLSLHDRDFKLGSSVLEYVAKSRKIILIVSEDFVKSQWFTWETLLTMNSGLFLKDIHDSDEDTLIIIKLGYISPSHITPTLKYLLRTKTPLQWDVDPRKQRAFFEQLRSMLTVPKISIRMNPYVAPE